jgi:hypothetical protein
VAAVVARAVVVAEVTDLFFFFHPSSRGGGFGNIDEDSFGTGNVNCERPILDIEVLLPRLLSRI